MNWDDIRFFLAVARGGSISKAATALEVNYTTVVRRIEQFEGRLNNRLFERLPSGYVMTASAEAVFHTALTMEENAQSFERSLFGQDHKLSGRLTITASDAVATHLLISQLPRFQREHPEIELIMNTSDSVVDLNLREADVAVRLTASPPEHLLGKRITGASYGVFASKSYRKKHRNLNHEAVQILTWTDLSAPPAWHGADFPRAKLGPQFNSSIALLQAIQDGLGIGSLPDFMIPPGGGIERVNKTAVDSDWALWILSHPDTRSTARLRRFREFLAKILLEQRTSIEWSKRQRQGAQRTKSKTHPAKI